MSYVPDVMRKRVYDKDNNQKIDKDAIDVVTSYETIHHDTTVHTTTSTSYVSLHAPKSVDYDCRVGTFQVEYRYRTTGSATAYVLTEWRFRSGERFWTTSSLSSTTSTTTISAFHFTQDARVFYGSDTLPTFDLQFKTSDETVEAEVSEETITVSWGKLVRS